MTIESAIENIYSDLDLNEESNYIWNYDSIFKEITVKTNSRYKLSGINYKPYTLTEQCLKSLFKRIIIIPSLGNKSENELVNYDSNTMVIYNITLNKLPIYKGDLTPAGLLNIRLGSAINNLELYNKVNEEFSKFMVQVNVGLNNYWIPHDLMEKLTSDDNLNQKLIKSCGYKWRLQ